MPAPPTTGPSRPAEQGGSSAALEDAPCPLCGGTDVACKLEDRAIREAVTPSLTCCTSLDHGVYGRIVQCRTCGLRFRSPRESPATIAGWYADVEDPLYLTEELGRVATFSRALDRLETRVPRRGQLLDVGCYTGVFLGVAEARGWPVTGIEPSRWASEVARRRGHTVHQGSIATAPMPAHGFAVITMWDVIEHLADPVRELELAHAAASDDGWLVVSTLNVDAWIARLLGGRWPWYMRMHLIYYTRRTLAAVLARAGWRTVVIEPYAHVVSLGYLALKLGAYAPRISRWLSAALHRLQLDEKRVPIAFGDCVTAYAVKDVATPGDPRPVG
jgi:SAM-dependent methyltransferase